MVVGESHYSVGKRYCRKCECYFMTMRALLRMLRYAAKSYSIGKRIQGEDEIESSYCQQKQLHEATELRGEISTGRQTFYAWDKPLVT
jgi:hypothetical protein